MRIEMDLTVKEKLLVNFIKYVSLNVMGMIGLSCYILADTLFVANGLGSNGLTALNLVLPVYSFISGIGLWIGIGAATRYAILHGEGNSKEGNRVFTVAMICAVVVGVLLSGIGLFASEAITRGLGADKTIAPMANDYLKTVMLFAPAFIVNQLMVSFVRNDGNPKLSMIAMLTGSVSNIVLDYILIFPLGLGMFGAALATGVAPLISLIILSTHFRKKNHFKIVKMEFRFCYVAVILKLGISSFITEFSSGIIMLAFNFIILQIAGNVGVAAYGVIANLALIVVAIFTGMGQGIQPMLSVNFGAKQLENTKKIVRLALCLAIGFGVVINIVGFFFANPIIGIFNSEKNPMLEELAVTGIRLYFLAFPMMGINIVATSFFSSVEQPQYSFGISITRGFIAVLGFLLLLSRFFGMTGIWMTIPCAELITLVMIGSLLYYRKLRTATF